MYARHRQYQALSLASRIEGASPHELVVILYEELIRTIDVCRTAIAQGKPEALRPAHDRAISLLISLREGLDHERGGSLAQSLSGIYAAMMRNLGRAVQGRDSDELSTLRQGVADLLGAWLRIGRPV
jgi:flagellar protein FliS